MLSLRKLVIALLVFSILPVTVVLVVVKILLSSYEKSTQKPVVNNKTYDDLEEVSTPTIQQIPLTIFAPVNGATVFTSSVTVKGVTASLAEVYVNAASSSADLEGNFAVNVPLVSGKNPIIVLVRDASGKYEQMEIEVKYEGSLDKL